MLPIIQPAGFALHASRSIAKSSGGNLSFFNSLDTAGSEHTPEIDKPQMPGTGSPADGPPGLLRAIGNQLLRQKSRGPAATRANPASTVPAPANPACFPILCDPAISETPGAMSAAPSAGIEGNAASNSTASQNLFRTQTATPNEKQLDSFQTDQGLQTLAAMTHSAVSVTSANRLAGIAANDMSQVNASLQADQSVQNLNVANENGATPGVSTSGEGTAVEPLQGAVSKTALTQPMLTDNVVTNTTEVTGQNSRALFQTGLADSTQQNVNAAQTLLPQECTDSNKNPRNDGNSTKDKDPRAPAEAVHSNGDEMKSAALIAPALRDFHNFVQGSELKSRDREKTLESANRAQEPSGKVDVPAGGAGTDELHRTGVTSSISVSSTNGDHSRPQPDQCTDPTPTPLISQTNATSSSETSASATVTPLASASQESKAEIAVNVPKPDTTHGRDLVPVQPAPPGQVHAARFFQNGDQAEMRISLRMEIFGGVDLHATVTGKQVQVELGSQRGDLRSFLTPELPALQNSLQQHDLRLEQVRTLAHAAGRQPEFSSGSGRQQQFSRSNPTKAACSEPSESAANVTFVESKTGLDIRI